MRVRSPRRSPATGGFSLIELLVVVLILGVLAAIAVPGFLAQRDRADDSAAKSLVRNAATAVETGFTDTKTYAVATLTTGKLGAIAPGITWTTDAADSATSADKVAFTGTSSTGYTLTTTSDSGTAYALTKAGRSVTRTCGAGCTW